MPVTIRNLLVCGTPLFILLLGYIWYRERRKDSPAKSSPKESTQTEVKNMLEQPQGKEKESIHITVESLDERFEQVESTFKDESGIHSEISHEEANHSSLTNSVLPSENVITDVFENKQFILDKYQANELEMVDSKEVVSLNDEVETDMNMEDISDVAETRHTNNHRQTIVNSDLDVGDRVSNKGDDDSQMKPVTEVIQKEIAGATSAMPVQYHDNIDNNSSQDSSSLLLSENMLDDTLDSCNDTSDSLKDVIDAYMPDEEEDQDHQLKEDDIVLENNSESFTEQSETSISLYFTPCQEMPDDSTRTITPNSDLNKTDNYEKNQKKSLQAEADITTPLQSENTTFVSRPECFSTPSEEIVPSEETDVATSVNETDTEGTHSQLVHAQQHNGQPDNDSQNADSQNIRNGEKDKQTNSSDHFEVYQFIIPSNYCGMLIGKRGMTVNAIKDQSGAEITVMNSRKYTNDPNMQLCSVEGSCSSVETAIKLIRRKLPKRQFPKLSMKQVNDPQDKVINKKVLPQAQGCPVITPETMQLTLPQGVPLEVVISSIVSGAHFFVQQPTHPTFTSLERLNQFMFACYNQDGIVPQLPRPVDVGVICAAPMYSGWYRAQVVNKYEETDECDIKYLDYGGYSKISSSSLKQIRSDFMTLPFQAIECYLANVVPVKDDEPFDIETATVLEELTQGHMLQLRAVGTSNDGTPYVSLFLSQGSNALYINHELMTRGVARWAESKTC